MNKIHAGHCIYTIQNAVVTGRAGGETLTVIHDILFILAFCSRALLASSIDRMFEAYHQRYVSTCMHTISCKSTADENIRVHGHMDNGPANASIR